MRPCCATPALRPLGYELRCHSCGTTLVPVTEFTGRVYLPTVVKAEATRRLEVR